MYLLYDILGCNGKKTENQIYLREWERKKTQTNKITE